MFILIIAAVLAIAIAITLKKSLSKSKPLLQYQLSLVVLGNFRTLRISFLGTSTAEIYNPITRAFLSVGSMKYRRVLFTLTLLPSGQVLATVGIDWITISGCKKYKL